MSAARGDNRAVSNASKPRPAKPEPKPKPQPIDPRLSWSHYWFHGRWKWSQLCLALLCGRVLSLMSLGGKTQSKATYFNNSGSLGSTTRGSNWVNRAPMLPNVTTDERSPAFIYAENRQVLIRIERSDYLPWNSDLWQSALTSSLKIEI